MLEMIPEIRVAGNQTEPAPGQWRPGIAALLSLVAPGAGQLYSGKTLPGLMWLPAVVCCYVVFPALGAAAHGVCIYDATEHKTDQDLLDDVPPVHVSKRGAYLFAAMFFLITVIAFSSITTL